MCGTFVEQEFIVSSNRLKKDIHAYMADHGVRYQKARDAILSDNPSDSSDLPFNTAPYLETWARNEHTTDLCVPLGWYISSGVLSPNVFELNLAEVSSGGTGPHGCLQGKTGSGKSYTLRNIVTALCTTYSPSKVNIIAIDFKGGSTFDDVGQFPHFVTNLKNLEEDPDRVEKLGTDIADEMERRETLLRVNKCRDIGEYRELCREDVSLEPLPYTFVIVDEFYEYMSSNRRHLRILSVICAKGRSLGIHLLLSSQFIDAGLLSNVMNHITYGISLAAVTQAHSRTVLDGDPSATTLRLGEALVRHVDSETDRNTVTKVHILDQDYLMENGTSHTDAVTELRTFSKLPHGNSDEWIIGGEHKSLIRVPRRKNVVFSGDEGAGKSTAMLSLIAASARQRDRGKDNSRWHVLVDTVTPSALVHASKFGNVASVLDHDDFADECAVDKLVQDVREAAEQGEPQYVVVDARLRDAHTVCTLLEQAPNVFFIFDGVPTEHPDTGAIRHRIARSGTTSEYPVRDAHMVELSIAVRDGNQYPGVCRMPSKHKWVRVAVPVIDGEVFDDASVKKFAASLTNAPAVIPVGLKYEAIPYPDLLRMEPPKDILPLGTVPLTKDVTGVPLSTGHMFIYGKYKINTNSAFRTYIQAITSRYTPDQAQFFVIDQHLDIAETVKYLVGRGYMPTEEYAVNDSEVEAVSSSVHSICDERIPTRDDALRGRLPNGKWYEGKEVFLVVYNTGMRAISPIIDLVNRYDTGVRIIYAGKDRGEGDTLHKNTVTVHMSDRKSDELRAEFSSGRCIQFAEPTI